MSDIILGIDLGTTNSLVSVMRDGHVELIPNGHGDYITPSAVFLDDQSLLVGKEAITRGRDKPHCLATGFKRRMGSDKAITLGTQRCRPEELSAYVLKSLKQDAESYIGQTISKAVISVPAYFNSAQREATLQAGEIAGLQVLRLINEPTAAALAYHQNIEEFSARCLVFDLGGGTFDVSIVELNGPLIEVRASCGDNYLGGDDFTRVIAEHALLANKLEKHHLTPQEYTLLLSQAEMAKHGLSQEDACEFEFHANKKAFTFSLTRESFVVMVRDLLEAIEAPLRRAVSDAKVQPDLIDKVILVGGASRLHAVKKIVSSIFKKIPLSTIDPDKSICVGTGVMAGMISNDQQVTDNIMIDVCPYTLGVEAIELTPNQQPVAVFSPIIERNSALPVSVTKRYIPLSEHQTSIDVDIYQGESLDARENISLANCSVALVADGKAHREGIDITFSYDVSGLLIVEVEGSAVEERVAIDVNTNGKALSDTQLFEARQRIGSIKSSIEQARERYQNILDQGHARYQRETGEKRLLLGEVLAQAKAALAQHSAEALSQACHTLENMLTD